MGDNCGGAIRSSDELVRIDYCEFDQNKVNSGGGGACQFESSVENNRVYINNSTFTSNIASYGSALSLGYKAGLMDSDTFVYISSSSFIGNQQTKPRWGGGSVLWNGGNVYTRISDLALYDNDGCGISTAYNARTLIHGRNGAVIFGNKAVADRSYSCDVSVDFDTSQISLSEGMFNGGSFHWQKDDAHSCWYSQPAINDVSKADVIMTGNISSYDPEYQPFGRTILNYGILEIGEAETSLEVQKVWEDDENAAGKRPSPETFLSSLEIDLNGAEYDAGDLSPVETYERADGKEVQRYHYSADSSLTAEFTAEGAQTWSVRLDGLPLEIDGEKAVYDIKEQPIPSYDAEIRETGEGVFSIRNSLIPEPTPTPVPEDEPTVFYLLMQGGSLPQTGFSSEHKGEETPEP